MRALLLIAAATASEIDYSGMLTSLWTKADTNEDGLLDPTEWVTAAGMLGISESIFINHDESFSVVFDAADADSDGQLTESELATAAMSTDFEAYQDELVAAFTNGAGEAPSEVPTPTDAMVTAEATVTVELTVAGSPDTIYAGQREQIRAYFADLVGGAPEDVLMTVLAAERRRARKDRRLSETESIISATMFCEDADQVDEVEAALPTSADDFTTIPAFAGVEVTAAPVVSADRGWTLPQDTLQLFGIVLVVAGVGMCIFAQVATKTVCKPKKGITPKGVCKKGCCSFDAVPAWAFNEFVAGGLIAYCVFQLYSNMQGLTDVILGLIDTLNTLGNSDVEAVASFTSMIPSDIVDQINARANIIGLLPFLVMGPGAVAIVFLLLGALCPVAPVRKGSYKCSKCSIMVANVFLVLSAIFYMIFVVVAVIINYAPPEVKVQINTITGMCQTIPAMVKQLITDNSAAVDQLEAAGVTSGLDDMRAALAEVEALSLVIDDGCASLNGLFTEFENLFLPGVQCVIAILFALFVNNMLCCAEGCCRSPPTAASDEPALNKPQPDEKGIIAV